AVLEDPKMPAMSTVLDQAHNAMDRQLFAMKGFHHPGGSQTAFLTGLAHLYNLIPYQRRALNAGKCGVEVEGGVLPTSDWLLNLQILTSGGYRCARLWCMNTDNLSNSLRFSVLRQKTQRIDFLIV